MFQQVQAFLVRDGGRRTPQAAERFSSYLRVEAASDHAVTERIYRLVAKALREMEEVPLP